MTYDDDSAEELLDRLRTLSRRVDPVPEAVKDAASASFRFRNSGSEVNCARVFARTG